MDEKTEEQGQSTGGKGLSEQTVRRLMWLAIAGGVAVGFLANCLMRHYIPNW